MAANLSLSEFQRWKIDDLKQFIRQRSDLQITNRRKCELAAIAFAICEQQLPVSATVSSSERQVTSDYNTLLSVQVNGQIFIVPDPFSLADGWISEIDSISLWPPISYVNISQYLLEREERQLLMRLGNDYKEGKAFSYFASQQSWVKDIWYHEITTASPVCFLQTECTPSQRVRDSPHRLWVIVEKKTGCIKSGYCSCVAGLGSTCNHIAALLFKIDYAWQQGMTSGCPKATTSVPNSWLTPVMRSVDPMRARDMITKKPRYGNISTRVEASLDGRRSFVPVRSSKQQDPLSMDELVSSFYPECPTAVAFHYATPDSLPQYDPSTDINVGAEEITTADSKPTPFHLYAEQFSGVDGLLQNLPCYSTEACQHIEELTRGQADNADWYEYKQGCISASVAHRVYRAMSTNASSASTREHLIQDIVTKHRSTIDLPALQHGRATEPVAADVYTDMQRATHSGLSVDSCGVFVDHSNAFLCASPDRLVECGCCGEGLLEVKCPYPASGDPNFSKLQYLEIRDGSLHLKHNHAYYTQIQMQMGITKRHWCDFFVYSCGEKFLERVYFDSVYWDSLKDACCLFFQEYIAHRLVKQ